MTAFQSAGHFVDWASSVFSHQYLNPDQVDGALGAAA
jgi:hypothetical protein